MPWWPFWRRKTQPVADAVGTVEMPDELDVVRGSIFVPKPGKTAIDFAPSADDVVGMVSVSLTMYAVTGAYGSFWIVQDERTKRLAVDRSPFAGAQYVLEDVLKESILNDDTERD